MVSRQWNWKQRMKAEGRCEQCGGYPLVHYKHKCDKCELKWRRLKRDENGFKPWRPGGPGRKPLIPDDGGE